MFAIFFKIAISQFIRHPLYSIINVAGLSLGLACTVLIFMFVRDELSFDGFFEESGNIVRVTTELNFPGARIDLATVSGAAGKQLVIDREEVLNSVRLFNFRSMLQTGDKKFFEEGTIYADPSIFEVFDIEFVDGDIRALDQPNTIVLTESLARKYFGDSEILGEVMTISNQIDVKVTGIIADLPKNTHLNLSSIIEIDVLPQFSSTPDDIVEGWGGTNTYTYLLLADGTDIEALEATLPVLLTTYAPPFVSEVTTLYLERLTDIHLYAHHENEMKQNGRASDVYIFSAVALFILLIACINFTNLTTARATVRLTEVGMRKVMGAHPFQVGIQYLGEATVVSMVAMVGALFLAWLAMPWLSGLVGREIVFALFQDPMVPAALIVIVIVTGILAGTYPAFYLSRFSPAAILGGTAGGARGSLMARRMLVVFQFALSIGLMIGTGVIYGQMNFVNNMDPGYNPRNVLVYSGIFPRQEILDAYPALRDAVAMHPDVLSVSGGQLVPTEVINGGTTMTPPGGDPDSSISFWLYNVDYNYFETLGIRLLAGRDFSREFGTDVFDPIGSTGTIVDGVAVPNGGTASIILNLAGVERAGFDSAEEAIGKVMFSNFTNPDDEPVHWDYPIIGVVEDFHARSAHEAILPMVYFLSQPPIEHLIARVRPGTVQQTARDLDDIWSDWVPNFPVTRSFLEDRYNALYDIDNRQMELFTAFSALAILVASLGLIGLASFTAERRRLEIGIRKIHGASAFHIVNILAWDLSKLVLLANILAWPVAWYLMQIWLEGIAYRIDLSPVFFVAAGTLALGVAWATVSLQSSRIAVSRPASSLRED